MGTEGGLFDPIALESLQMRLEHWALTRVLVWSSLAQVGGVAAGAGLGWLLGRRLVPALARLEARAAKWDRALRALVAVLPSLAFPAAFLLLMVLAQAAAVGLALPHGLVTTAVSLLAAWIVIRLTASVIRNREAARSVALVAWALAALNIVGLLDPTLALLDGVALPLGARRVTLLTVAKAIILFAVLLWLARAAVRFAAGRLQRSTTLTPSIKVLSEKSINILLLAVVVFVTLDYVGVDLTTLAVFTGALGVGIGFGLQKVVSNLVSGFILLLDRSIKPGDVIELGETFGWVTSLGARYVALSTREGKEWLIPNEDLITQRVINWSYSNNLLRLPLKFGVSYHSDVRKAMVLAIEAASAVERVLSEPKPVCRLIGFGDSSVDFELRVWIRDPQSGVVNVRSDIYLALWDTFHAEGIEIPFPQRDLHVQEGSQINVTLSPTPGAKPAGP
jgi:small-conductance mechanosensitive channel